MSRWCARCGKIRSLSVQRWGIPRRERWGIPRRALHVCHHTHCIGVRAQPTSFRLGAAQKLLTAQRRRMMSGAEAEAAVPPPNVFFLPAALVVAPLPPGVPERTLSPVHLYYKPVQGPLLPEDPTMPFSMGMKPNAMRRSSTTPVAARSGAAAAPRSLRSNGSEPRRAVLGRAPVPSPRHASSSSRLWRRSSAQRRSSPRHAMR